MANRRVDVKVRVTPEQHAQLVAAARSLGLSLSDYMAFKSIGDARDQAIFERMDALEGALASALEAHREALADDAKTAIAAGNERTQKALKSMADWLQKRLGELGVSVPAAPSAAQKQE
jgi:uncharacterized protein (DUF1778 family)